MDLDTSLQGLGADAEEEEDEEAEGRRRKNLDMVLDHELLKESAVEFERRSVKNVSHTGDERVLCVLQREFAACRVADVDVLGSDDATTCIVVVFKLGATAMACAHFDNSVAIARTGCGVVKMYEAISEVAAAAGRGSSPLTTTTTEEDMLDVWIVGGFLDDRNLSAATLGLLLAALNALPRAVNLQLVYAERRNTRTVDGVHHPRFIGAAISEGGNVVVPAHFTHLGPALGLRSVLSCSGEEELFSCYNWKTNRIEIMFPYGDFEAAEALLEAPDEFLLANVSTSPKQEPPRFLSTLRAALKYLVDHPECSETFKNGPICFERQKSGPVAGAWLLVRTPEK